MTLISADEALRLVLNAVPPALPESRALSAALGCVLAEDICANEDFPAFARAMMDGFAMRLRDAGQVRRVCGTIRAGDGADYELPEGGVFAIMTGAPCPKGCEAVAPIEAVRLEGEKVHLPAPLWLGQHIAPKGSECAKGTLVLPRSTRLTPPAIAALATLGVWQVPVLAPPKLALITTGDELVQGDAPLAPGQIRDANGPLLRAMSQNAGFEVSALASAKDTKEALAKAITEQSAADILILSGGVSMGAFDLVPQTLHEQGATLVFHQVAQKPGKPLLFATRGRQLIFGLPGTPLGTAFSFHRYVLPAARRLSGQAAKASTHSGALKETLKVRGERRCFFPAFAAPLPNGTFELTPLVGRGSSDVFSWVAANAWLDAGTGPRELAPKERVVFEWMNEHD